MTTQTLEQTLEDFRRQCESFARKQQPRCGLIYELYQRRLSADIDGYLAGVSLDIENYCTLRLFFDLSTLAGLSRRNLPEAGIRLLFQI